MQAIKCEICGSTDILKKDGVFVCQYCGTKYSAEEVRNLLGTVRIDKSGDTENYLILARRALNESNFEKAEEYFELVLRNDPNHLEAMFFCPFCTAMKSDLQTLQYAAGRFRQSLLSVFSAIAAYDQDDKSIQSVADLVFQNALFFCRCKYQQAEDACRSLTKNAGGFEHISVISRGMHELSTVYYSLELIAKQQFPKNISILTQILQEELGFYKKVGKYFMKAIPLMKEKNRLKNELHP